MVQICILINTRDVGGEASDVIGAILYDSKIFFKGRGSIFSLIELEVNIRSWNR